MAAFDITDETGNAGESAARTSGRATENTQKFRHIILNSLLPCLVEPQIGEFHDRSGEVPNQPIW